MRSKLKLLELLGSGFFVPGESAPYYKSRLFNGTVLELSSDANSSLNATFRTQSQLILQDGVLLVDIDQLSISRGSQGSFTYTQPVTNIPDIQKIAIFTLSFSQSFSKESEIIAELRKSLTKYHNASLIHQSQNHFFLRAESQVETQAFIEQFLRDKMVTRFVKIERIQQFFFAKLRKSCFSLENLRLNNLIETNHSYYVYCQIKQDVEQLVELGSVLKNRFTFKIFKEETDFVKTAANSQSVQSSEINLGQDDLICLGLCDETRQLGTFATNSGEQMQYCVECAKLYLQNTVKQPQYPSLQLASDQNLGSLVSSLISNLGEELVLQLIIKIVRHNLIKLGQTCCPDHQNDVAINFKGETTCPVCFRYECQICNAWHKTGESCVQIRQCPNCLDVIVVNELENCYACVCDNQMAGSQFLELKSCPLCGIQCCKSQGCNYVICNQCNTKWCYSCGYAIDGVIDHYRCQE